MRIFLKHSIFFLIYVACFFGVVFIIFQNHHNPAFWFQSDNAWAPHFVFDIMVNHNSPLDWQLANGTIHLLSTLPFLVFSFFNHNMVTWIYYNAIFNLCLYFLCFFLLARSLSSDIKACLLMLGSCLVSLGLVASFKQIPFTLDMLLVSGQHTTQLIVACFSLVLCIHLLKKADSIFWFVLLFLLVSLCVLSDELFLLSFVAPALLSLAFYFFLTDQDSKKIIKIIICILAALLVGRFLWFVNPLHYHRVTSYFATHQIIVLIKALLFYFSTFYKKFPVYLSINFLYFLLSIVVIIRAIKQKQFRSSTRLSQRMQLLVLLFCTCVWVTGLGGIVINYHLLSFYQGGMNFNPIVHVNFDGLNRDGMAFLVLPVFVGFPVLIIYSLSRGLFWANVMVMLLLGWLGFDGVRLIRPHQPSALQSQQSIMQCLSRNIKKYHLHTGIANYWIYRPIVLMSNGAINIAAIYSGPRVEYEHYLSTWQDINNRTVDYWIYSYDVFFKDPVYTNYYNEKVGVRYKLKKFGKPTGQFTCKNQNQEVMRVYIYKNDALMRAIVDSLSFYGLKNADINSEQKIQLNNTSGRVAN